MDAREVYGCDDDDRILQKAMRVTNPEALWSVLGLLIPRNETNDVGTIVFFELKSKFNLKMRL